MKKLSPGQRELNFMTLSERSEIMTRLYRLHAETVAGIFLCRELNAPVVNETLCKIRDELQERINDMSGKENEK